MWATYAHIRLEAISFTSPIAAHCSTIVGRSATTTTIGLGWPQPYIPAFVANAYRMLSPRTDSILAPSINLYTSRLAKVPLCRDDDGVHVCCVCVTIRSTFLPCSLPITPANALLIHPLCVHWDAAVVATIPDTFNNIFMYLYFANAGSGLNMSVAITAVNLRLISSFHCRPRLHCHWLWRRLYAIV